MTCVKKLKYTFLFWEETCHWMTRKECIYVALFWLTGKVWRWRQWQEKKFLFSSSFPVYKQHNGIRIIEGSPVVRYTHTKNISYEPHKTNRWMNSITRGFSRTKPSSLLRWWEYQNFKRNVCTSLFFSAAEKLLRYLGKKLHDELGENWGPEDVIKLGKKTN